MMPNLIILLSFLIYYSLVCLFYLITLLNSFILIIRLFFYLSISIILFFYSLFTPLLIVVGQDLTSLLIKTGSIYLSYFVNNYSLFSLVNNSSRLPVSPFVTFRSCLISVLGKLYVN